MFDVTRHAPSPLQHAVPALFPMVTATLVLVVVTGTGCDRPFGGLFSTDSDDHAVSVTLGDAGGANAAPVAPDSTWTHDSERAPYSMKLSTDWSRLGADDLNPHADLAVTQHKRLYLMVLPQPLPAFEGMEAPGARALRSAGLRRMREQIDKFRLEDQGPVTVDDVSGVSAIAEGLVGSTLVQYIATFVTHDGWGYQVIAWGPAKAEAELVTEVDRALRGWQFRDDSVVSPTSAPPDAAAPGGEAPPDTSTPDTPDASGS